MHALQKCADSELSDKTNYPTFARTLPPLGKIAKSLVSVLLHFEWKRVVVVASNHSANFHKIQEAFSVRKLMLIS